MNYFKFILAALVFTNLFASLVQGGEDIKKKSQDQLAFEKAEAGDWNQVMSDPGTGNWRDKWFLDGKAAKVSNHKDGMTLEAGPEFKNNAHHMVLWTKDVFAGDVKVEFEFTRLDAAKRSVNIIYIEASGSGKGPYNKDISKWNKLREIPAMGMYFNHMNTYHISYAAYPNSGKVNDDYVRARRYMPEAKGLRGTELKPDYFSTGLFNTGVPHKFTIIKRGNDLTMRVVNDKKTSYFHWRNDKFPPIDSGRIGLRLMFTRSSRIKDFRVSKPK